VPGICDPAVTRRTPFCRLSSNRASSFAIRSLPSDEPCRPTPARPLMSGIGQPYSCLQSDKTALDGRYEQLQLGPVVAVVVTLPYLAGSKPSQQLSRGGATDQRVRHEIDWLGEAADELLPRSTVATKDCSLSVVGVGLDARCDRDIPAVRINRVGRDGPAIPSVQS
jgi:hypothetical protein